MAPNKTTNERRDMNSRRIANASGKRFMADLFNYFRARISVARMAAAISALLLACLLCAPLPAAEETIAQQTFPSPGAATSALAAAGKANDMKALSSILGQDADQILSSGDPVADTNARKDFVSRYQEMHRLAYDDQGRVILYLGAANWPFPIPLVKKDGGWVSIRPPARTSCSFDE
jgi:hypothetical protein